MDNNPIGLNDVKGLDPDPEDGPISDGGAIPDDVGVIDDSPQIDGPTADELGTSTEPSTPSSQSTEQRATYTTGSTSNVGMKGSADRPYLSDLWNVYESDGQKIIKDNGGTDPNKSLKQFEGQNTCAIRMSYALNSAGYCIAKPSELPSNIHAVTGTDGKSYIYRQEDMGNYLRTMYGDPDITCLEVTPQNYLDVMEQLKGLNGIIQFIAGDAVAYEASGHVDLIGEQGPDTDLKGSNVDIKDYLREYKDVKFTINVWVLPKERSIKPLNDNRNIIEKIGDYLFGTYD
jgi:hypothetical protein